jgi:hypothetical protein
MKFIGSLALFLFLSFNSSAQVDTINTDNLKLNIAALKEGMASYVVFFEDSLGNRITSADIWDRSIRFSADATGQKLFHFDWTWWRKDSLESTVQATGLLPSLKPLVHNADYVRRGKFAFAFDNNTVTIPPAYQKTGKDSAFKVVMDPPAYEFPMDLEIFPLLPFRKTGQQFAIAFYEPGTAKSNYYKLTVTGKINRDG